MPVHHFTYPAPGFTGSQRLQAKTPGGLFSITFYERDRLSGRPLEGAVYTLEGGGQRLAVRSGALGELLFLEMKAGSYTLSEIQPPAGYSPSGPYRITLRPDGSLLVNGRPAAGASLYRLPLFRLAFIQEDAQSGRPLSGARFRLSNGMQAVSGAGGWVDFGFLNPGSYTLWESTPPPGYVPNSRVYHIEASEDGRISVDGMELTGFSVEGQRYARFAFRKVDAQSGMPLPGATLRLSNGMQAQSGPDGWLDFGTLVPGLYGLMEIDPPPGYQLSGRVYQVEAHSDGGITVDNRPVSGFVLVNRRLPETGMPK